MTVEPTKTILISEKQIEDHLSMHQVNDSVDETFKGFGEGTVKCPTKVTLDLGQNDDWPDYDGYVNAMPAYIGFEDMAGLKWVAGVGGERREADLPYINGMILLLDPHVGEFVAVMDGTYITNQRTGSQAANCIRYFCQGEKEISVGLYGAGKQAHTSLAAISDLFTIKHLDIWNRHKDRAERLAKDMADYVEGDITVVDTPEEASHNKYTVTTTAATEPFLEADWFGDGQVIIPLGSSQELSDDLITKADNLIVDHPGQAHHRGCIANLLDSGKLEDDDITCTIGDVAAGNKTFDNLDNELTIAVPIGTGALDVAIAAKIYKEVKDDASMTTFTFQDDEK